jgi:hypothetical protein
MDTFEKESGVPVVTKVETREYTGHLLGKRPPPLPIACRLDVDRQLFRVFRCRGRNLGTGGFGVVFPSTAAADDDSEDDATAEENGQRNLFLSGKEPGEHESVEVGEDAGQPTTTSTSYEYLFVEEVLFLHEQGFLAAYDEHENVLDAVDLYQRLDALGVSLAAYLVYAHLRVQTFRVVRHTSTRRRILVAMEQLLQDATDPEDRKREMLSHPMHSLRQKLRDDATKGRLCPMSSNEIAFDVYKPNSEFSRSCPGLPNFHVAMSFNGHGGYTFFQLSSLLQACENTPLKVATVSDSGVVSMFGLTGEGVPCIMQGASSDTTQRHKISGSTSEV